MHGTNDMSETERYRHVSSFRSISNENIEKLHADEVQRKAVFLLNHETAIIRAQSIDQRTKVSYLAAGKIGTSHCASVSSALNIRCSCHSAVCGHSLAIAHKENIVLEFCKKSKRKKKILSKTVYACQ